MLDDSEEYVDLGVRYRKIIYIKSVFFLIQKDDTGKMFYTRVCELMHLEEKDYFGLTFLNNENTRVSLEIF